MQEKARKIYQILQEGNSTEISQHRLDEDEKNDCLFELGDIGADHGQTIIDK